jgi:hypothetical protein
LDKLGRGVEKEKVEKGRRRKRKRTKTVPSSLSILSPPFFFLSLPFFFLIIFLKHSELKCIFLVIKLIVKED